MKITYILGAGASAQGLPTVKQIKATSNTTGGLSLAQEFALFADEIKLDKSISKDNEQYRKELVDTFNDLSYESNNFGTTDTFAKHLFLKGKLTELRKLKDALAIFFFHRQVVKERLDKRPLIFLTTVMESGFNFPAEIGIINWNLDFQIQFAARAFIEDSFFNNGGGSTISVNPLISYFPSEFKDHAGIIYSMVQMNGIAGFYQQPQTNLITHFYDNDEIYNLDILLSKVKIKSEFTNLITFGWEKKKQMGLSDIIEKAKETVKETEILVVIGYSFPFFNRESDREVFESIKASGKLKKIYFQDPVREGEFLINQFDLHHKNNIYHLKKPIEIVNVKDVENYFVPFEL